MEACSDVNRFGSSTQITCLFSGEMKIIQHKSFHKPQEFGRLDKLFTSSTPQSFL